MAIPIGQAPGRSPAIEVTEHRRPASTARPKTSGGGSEASLEAHVTRIVALYREVGRALRAADPADWAAGLTIPQLRVLIFLERAGLASVGEVAAGVGVSQPSATETLDRLAKSGLVERMPDASDRRVVRNALTPAGQEMIDQPWETRRAVLANALRHASEADREAIERGLALACDVLATHTSESAASRRSGVLSAEHGSLPAGREGAGRT